MWRMAFSLAAPGAEAGGERVVRLQLLPALAHTAVEGHEHLWRSRFTRMGLAP